MRFGEWIMDAFATNPFVWILSGLLVIAIYGNYTIGHDLNRVCQLLGDHPLGFAHPANPREEIDTICIRHDPDQGTPE